MAAEAHYIARGRSEGRLYKFDEDQFGQIPADFDSEAYIGTYPDLEQLRGRPIAAKAHYLSRGRPEGRSYKAAVPSGYAREASILKRPPETNWRDLFKPGDFRVLYPDLADGATTGDALLAAFQARGIDAMAALSLNCRFDPTFYAEVFIEPGSLTLPERYRDWLEKGIPAGRPGSEEDAVRNLLGLPTFPDSFDWKRYAGSLDPVARGWPRIRLLEHLLNIGVPQGEDVPVIGDGPGLFLLAVSDALWASERRKRGMEVLQQALNLAPDDAELHQRMAHRYIEIGRQKDAENHLRRAFALGKSSIWIHATLAELASQRGDAAESYRLLEESRGRGEGMAPWRNALRKAVEADYVSTTGRAWDLYRAGERTKADASLTEGLERIADRLLALEDLPAYVGPTEHGHIVLFANHASPFRSATWALQRRRRCPTTSRPSHVRGFATSFQTALTTAMRGSFAPLSCMPRTAKS